MKIIVILLFYVFSSGIRAEFADLNLDNSTSNPSMFVGQDKHYFIAINTTSDGFGMIDSLKLFSKERNDNLNLSLSNIYPTKSKNSIYEFCNPSKTIRALLTFNDDVLFDKRGLDRQRLPVSYEIIYPTTKEYGKLNLDMTEDYRDKIKTIEPTERLSNAEAIKYCELPKEEISNDEEYIVQTMTCSAPGKMPIKYVKIKEKDIKNHRYYSPRTAKRVINGVVVFMSLYTIYSWWDTFSFQKFHFINEGVGRKEYSGDSDTFSHAEMVYFLTRIFASGYESLGFDKYKAAKKGLILGMIIGLGVELGDGFTKWGFSKKDLAADLVGGLLGYWLHTNDAIDKRFAFRIRIEHWLPRTGYTDLSHSIELKLSGFYPDSILRFIRLGYRFQSKYYLPVELENTSLMPERSWTAFAQIDLSQVLSELSGRNDQTKKENKILGFLSDLFNYVDPGIPDLISSKHVISRVPRSEVRDEGVGATNGFKTGGLLLAGNPLVPVLNVKTQKQVFILTRETVNPETLESCIVLSNRQVILNKNNKSKILRLIPRDEFQLALNYFNTIQSIPPTTFSYKPVNVSSYDHVFGFNKNEEPVYLEVFDTSNHKMAIVQSPSSQSLIDLIKKWCAY